VKRAARHADEDARRKAAEAEAQAERDAADAMRHAVITRLVPDFETLKGEAAGAFDYGPRSSQGRQGVSWLVFQFDDQLQTFRVGVRGGELLVERRVGASDSDFHPIQPPEIGTVIAAASDLTDENIAALLTELSNLPLPNGHFGRIKADLDGNPLP
jgi:hypothetical protein